MTATDLPFLYVHSPAAFRSAFQHSHNVHHIRLMAEVHTHLTTLLRLPDHDHESRLRGGFTLLGYIANSLEDPRVGAMREEFLRKLFGMGEQILRFLEAAINRRHGSGGKKVIAVGGLAEGFREYGGKRTMTQVGQRHMRHYAVVASAQTAFGLPIEEGRRIAEACDVALLCAGVVMQVRLPGLITWYLPEIARQDRRWEAEMQYYAIKGLQAAAQCFGHKFMRWPVEIRDQQVPGTGVQTGEVLDDWVAIDED
ncbi:hypothetical protein LTR91_017324 [Friedmanniomyces endolithicus]|uniref:Uncharacterized protein n=1 Tax=Friedmanniomyces endolithicus TaxID=329885 RepID=A0AAN6QJQ2_9PEZI|nr:hypothetical protein LTR94_007523 [Friedmanniomyces endolithicus]KAK0805573.1 hypothetical protein LTR38_005474 [Friedmanniomyces endolithicus]KAK0813393.1 hypothetical protein LTR59_001179 [Friedmanniomyces endolithicus]KAK0821377.1 hypothetical protein LTR75_000852 [Friedmanniomyces endolithicus]KAK0851511.1 hypothetical protein LTR03_004023 [Friedmanniomyces endolithicus]